MKKILLFAGLFLIFVSAANAQDIFRKGTQMLNAGVGIGDGVPIELSYERSILDGLIKKTNNGAIGIGAYGSWYHKGLSDWSYNYFVIGARGAFHYQFVDKLDTYAGVMLGYNIASATWKGDGDVIGTAAGSAFAFSSYIGARYFFKPKLGVYLEAGYGIAYLSGGITLKF